MLFLIYIQYISFLLLPATNGLALIAPIVSWLFIRFVTWDRYQSIHETIRGHLFGQMMLSLWVTIRVISVAIVYEIIGKMESMSAPDKEIASYLTLVLAVYITARFYYTTIFNLRRFRRKAQYQKVIPLPLTKSKYDDMKASFSPIINGSNVEFQREGDAK
jgi:hypothetical protein